MKTPREFRIEQEAKMAAVRALLAQACHLASVGDIEGADAAVAKAANKLASVVQTNGRVFLLTSHYSSG